MKGLFPGGLLRGLRSRGWGAERTGHLGRTGGPRLREDVWVAQLVRAFEDAGFIRDGFRDQAEENEVSFVAAKRVQFSNRAGTLLGLL